MQISSPRGLACSLLLLTSCLAPLASAQQEEGLETELELGAIFTSGNTKDENIKFKGTMDWYLTTWEYGLSLDAFRSSKNDELAAQRVYAVATATYNITDSSFVVSRLAHEEDRFSGYDSQSDFTVSYGQTLLQDRENMEWLYTIGAGVRTSRSEEDDFNEGVIRAATEFNWDISENALFIQKLSMEAGEESRISRAESSIQTNIIGDLSMKFTIAVKHQSEVPEDRKRTDSEASVTLLLRL